MDHWSPNNDVVTEILLNLPVQSLLRFKTVSKSWCDIIDSSTFRKLHIQKQFNNNNDSDDSLFLQFTKGEKYIWELSIMFPDQGKSYKDLPAFPEFFNNNTFGGIRFGGPVNGLICMHSKGPFGKDRPSWILPISICNPSLGKIKILPKSPICSSFQNSYQEHPPANSRHIGFGFDYFTKEYKIVQLLTADGIIYIVEVYSLMTNTWKELVTDTLDQDLYIKKPIRSSYKNGSFAHWWAMRWDNIRRCYDHVLLSFDMHNEVFQTILIPDYESMFEYSKTKVFAKDDSFILFVYPRYYFACTLGLKIWELKSVGNNKCWTHVSSVGPFGPFQGVPKPMALWKNDGVVLMQRFKKKKELIFYDYCTRKIRGRFEVSESEKRFKILEYKGSMISP